MLIFLRAINVKTWTFTDQQMIRGNCLVLVNLVLLRKFLANVLLKVSVKIFVWSNVLLPRLCPSYTWKRLLLNIMKCCEIKQKAIDNYLVIQDRVRKCVPQPFVYEGLIYVVRKLNLTTIEIFRVLMDLHWVEYATPFNYC